MVLPSLKSLKTIFGSPRRRAGNGRKHKEKSSESGDSVSETISRDCPAGKTGHQVHPEQPAITIDKVNLMVNVVDWKEDSPPVKETDTDNNAPKFKTVTSPPSPVKARVAPFPRDEQPQSPPNNHQRLSTASSDAGPEKESCWETDVWEKDICLSDRSSWAASEADDPSSPILRGNEDISAISPQNTQRDGEQQEKTDGIKEFLEKRVEELEGLLEEERKNIEAEKQKQALTWLQQELIDKTPLIKENLVKELEREKSLRSEAETRLKEVTVESEQCKVRLTKLQEDFGKLEEMVCGMLQYKAHMDRMQQEKASLSLTYEAKLRKYQSYISNLEKENLMLLNEVKSLEATSKQCDSRERSLSRVLLERLRYLEAENSSLVLETEQQRLQYERCLDDVANQVVQALLAQKSLREECAKLQKQVSDLEQRNRALNLLFQQRLHFASDTVLQMGKDQMGKSSDSRSSSAEGSYHSLPAYQSPQTPKSKLLLPSTHKHNSSSQTNQSPITTRISQSEDSIESLASLCSEYSLHSSGSGGILGNNVGIHMPGMPQLSSPPLWLKEHFPPYLCNGSPAASLLGAMQNKGSLMQSQRATIFDSPPGMSNSRNNDKDQSQNWDANGFYDSIWPGLRLRDVEELYGTDELYNYAYDMEQSELLGTVVRNRSKRNCMKNDQNSKNDKGLHQHSLHQHLQQQQKQQDASSEEEDSSRRCTTYSENSPLSNSLSELPDLSVGLDAVETPNDEAPSFESLPLPVTNQKLNMTGQHRPVGELQNSNMACQKIPVSEMPNHNFSDTCEKLESPQRPCSLKLLSPSHRIDKCGSPTPTNGSYSSLKVRRHATCVGNVYTSPSAKPFPNEAADNTSASTSHDHRDKDNSSRRELDEKPLDKTLEVPSNTTLCKQLSSCKETDLVDHKQENKEQVILVNKLMFQTTCRDRSVTAEESGLDSTGSSPKIRSVSTSSSTHGNLSESPVSADGGGRDEGYSTMSSDVQCDQQCGTGHTNPVTRVETVFSFDTVLSKSGPMQDSGLGLAKSTEEASEDVDEITNAFENDLEQSLILVKDKKLTLETKESESDVSQNSTVQDNSTDTIKIQLLDRVSADEMDIKPNFNQKENPMGEPLKPAGSVTSLRSAGSCLSADKLISLCAPQGFKARPPELTFPPPRCIETADKGTVTDLLGSSEAILSDSNLSLSSGDSENRIPGLHETFEAQGASCDRLNRRSPRSSIASVSEVSETDSFDSLPAYLDSCKAPNRCTELKIVEDQDSDVFYVPFSCKLCPKKKKQRPRLQRLFRPNKLHRSESDSRLEINKDKLRCPRSVSLDVRKRLSQLPPEQHGSDGNIDKAGNKVGEYQGTSLWRSKAKLSLTEGDEAEEKAVHPSGQVASWQQQDSLNSLQSLESGETSAHHEAAASKLYSPEGSYISSDSEEVVDGAEGVYSEDWIESADSFQKNSQVKFTSDFVEDTQDWTMEYDQRLMELSHPDSLPMSGPLPAIQETTCELSEEMWQEGGQARASWCSSVADGSDNFLLNDHLSRSSNETPDEANCTTAVGSGTLEQDYSESIPGSEEGELKPIEVEFRRDFYHLCKVDSRSLNMSNRSLAVSDNGSTERDGALSRRSYSTEPEVAQPTLMEDVSKSTPNDISKPLSKENEGSAKNSKLKKPVNTNNNKCEDSPKHDFVKTKEDNEVQKEPETRTDVVPEVKSEPIKPTVKLNSEVVVEKTEQKDEHLATNLNHSLEDKVSTKEKLEELTAMMAQSHVADEEEQQPASQCPNSVAEPGHKEGCTTSWVHIEADVDLTDPKARANLLDSMLASSSSSSSSSECGEETREYQHLHELHRYRRHRRASERENCVLRYIPPTRPSILDRHDFYFRYGEQEQAAVASFDFLEDLSTSASDFGSAETLNVAEQEDNSNNREKNKDNKWFTKPSQEILAIKDCLANQELVNGEKMMTNSELMQAKANSELRGSNTTLDSHDCEAAERLSLSDSCAESFSSSSQSLNAIE